MAANTDPRKVARAIEEHLNDAVCYTANWLKSSLDLLENIRKIEVDEIPSAYYVLSDRAGIVKWSELLDGSE